MPIYLDTDFCFDKNKQRYVVDDETNNFQRVEQSENCSDSELSISLQELDSKQSMIEVS